MLRNGGKTKNQKPNPTESKLHGLPELTPGLPALRFWVSVSFLGVLVLGFALSLQTTRTRMNCRMNGAGVLVLGFF